MRAFHLMEHSSLNPFFIFMIDFNIVIIQITS